VALVQLINDKNRSGIESIAVGWWLCGIRNHRTGGVLGAFSYRGYGKMIFLSPFNSQARLERSLFCAAQAVGVCHVSLDGADLSTSCWRQPIGRLSRWLSIFPLGAHFN
jgi:hypothetical protein